MKSIEEELYLSAERLYGFAAWEVPCSNTPLTRNYVFDVEGNDLICESRYAPPVASEGELYTVLDRVAAPSSRRFSVSISVFRNCISAREYLKHLLTWSPVDLRWDEHVTTVGERCFGLSPMAENSLFFIRGNVVITVGELSDVPDRNALLELAKKIDTQIRTQPHT